jgi:hypothetical protein
MGIFSNLFRTPPEAAELASMRTSMLQINVHGGPAAMLEEFTNGLNEARQPPGYQGFLEENEYLPRIAAKACALMILSDLKKRLVIKGEPTNTDIGRIKASPEYGPAYTLFVDSDEIITTGQLMRLREEQLAFGKMMFDRVGQAEFRAAIQKSPLRQFVAVRKEQSEKDWQRWLRSGIRIEV